MVETTKKIENADLKRENAKNSDKNEEALIKVKGRFESMKKGRSEQEKVWDWVDDNLKAVPFIKGNGQVQPMIKLEEALIEAYIGTQDSSLPINVEADGKPDGVMLKLAQYTLDHFIYTEEVVQEIRLFVDYNKARYGTGIVFSGLEIQSQFVAKDSTSYFGNEDDLERIDSVHIKVRDVPIKDAYFDESARRIDDAVDCIYQEWLSLDEYKCRYLELDGKSRKGFVNADKVSTVQSQESGKGDVECVKIWHYFNKLYAKYIIVVNEEVVIYNGIATTKHWRLPLVPIQHYCNQNSIYGIGIPERYAVIKGLNQNFFSAMLGGAWLNSGTALILGEGQAIDGDIYIEPGEVSIIEMTKWSARDMTPYNSNINVQQLVNIIQLLDDIGTVLTGISVKAPYTSPGKTAFETSVMKEEQNNRLKTVYETRMHGLEKVFTIMLSNIFTFLPYQYAEKITDEQEKLQNYKWYQIPVENMKLIRDDNDKVIGMEEEKGYKDYFDLSDKLVLWGRWMKVRITTPATASTMKALEVENITKYIQAKQMVMNLQAQAQQTGQDPEHWAKINQRLDILFNIDKNNVDIKSNEQKLRESTAEMTNMVNSFILQWNDDEENMVMDQGQLQAPQDWGMGGNQNQLWSLLETVSSWGGDTPRQTAQINGWGSTLGNI